MTADQTVNLTSTRPTILLHRQPSTLGNGPKQSHGLPCRFALTLPTMRALSPIKDRAFQITGAGLSSLACAPASPFLNRLTARADALALALGLEID